MPYYALDYLPYQYLRKARRGRSGRSAVLGQAVKSAGIRNGNVALFSKITHCGAEGLRAPEVPEVNPGGSTPGVRG